LVQSGIERLELPEQLTEAARIVIGLFDYGIDAPAEMADILKIEDATARKLFIAFAAVVIASKEPIVVDLLVWGLPIQFAQELPENVSVRCHGCGANLASLPCQICGRRLLCERTADRSPHNRSGRPIREPKEPTDATPGSSEKIEIMRQRVARGEGPTHPDDRYQTYRAMITLWQIATMF
jgi:hypothetical protein